MTCRPSVVVHCPQPPPSSSPPMTPSKSPADVDAELQHLLGPRHLQPRPRRSFSARHVLLAYALGCLSVSLLPLVLSPLTSLIHSISRPHTTVTPLPASTDVHHYPPPSPTNAFPSLFPSDVGYPGPTPTGAEPALVATAPSYPIHTGAPHLLPPQVLPNRTHPHPAFDIFSHWGNLSPWFSVHPHAFGLNSTIDPPNGCRITALHLLHRHGARYPTGSASYGGPANFSVRLQSAPPSWAAHGQLAFLNKWCVSSSFFDPSLNNRLPGHTSSERKSLLLLAANNFVSSSPSSSTTFHLTTLPSQTFQSTWGSP